MALLARGHVYGEDLLCDPPKIKEAKRTKESIVVKFLYGDGLYIEGDALSALGLIDQAGETIIPQKVEIVNDELTLYGNLSKEVTLKFATSPYYEVNLYNENRNPAIPFQVTV